MLTWGVEISGKFRQNIEVVLNLGSKSRLTLGYEHIYEHIYQTKMLTCGVVDR
jgi:hypothetical protein